MVKTFDGPVYRHLVVAEVPAVNGIVPTLVDNLLNQKEFEEKLKLLKDSGCCHRIVAADEINGNYQFRTYSALTDQKYSIFLTKQ